MESQYEANMSMETQGIFDGEVLVTSSLSAVLAIMFVLGSSGNIYVLAITVLSPRPAGSLCINVINLALADLLYLSTIPFVVSTYLDRNWYFGDIGCRVLLSMDLFTMHASIYTLTAMSLQRYQVIVRPFSSHITQSHQKVLSLAIWLASFFLTLPMMCMIQLQDSHYGSGKKICFPTWTQDSFRNYLTVLFCTSILGPGIILVYIYSCLARAYWTPGLKVHQSRRKQKHCVGLRIFTIIILYWTCFVPFWAWQLAKYYQRELSALGPSAQIYLNFGVTCLTYANSCVNPLLYTLLTRNYWEYLAGRSRKSSGKGMQKKNLEM
ncbi:PREDICTED: urotensin-2 receptor-like [Nanorana parkeri]|uniref:urotensin-2 receptor-like n=1 Tax=Nanorana parkeri TaxID=125878 RepID=UPI000854E02D|nr:PREDICTED: urotensin-2 receptor-like [Nanorana parkeri]